MTLIQRAAMTAILAGIVAVVTVPSLVARAHASVASVALGTDDAFSVSGLEPRENLVGGGVIRWTQPRAFFRFGGMEPGDVRIEVNAHDHRSEVAITANGAHIGDMGPGQRHFESRVRVTSPDLVIGLETAGFSTSDRTLGTQAGSIVVTPESRAVPAPLWIVLGCVFMASLIAQLVAGLSSYLALLPPMLLAALVLPAGLFRAGWLFKCALLLILAAFLSAMVARKANGNARSRDWLALAILLALTIHGVIPPSPLMVQGDAQFHGNRLQDVASGDLFITSQTQHHPPFRFPYGFSFYAVLAPWVSSPSSNVGIVREGAALFSALSILALAWVLGRRSASLAAVATILWAFAPVNLRTMGFGNLSNVFAQAVLVLFLAGAMAPPAGFLRFAVLAFLVGLSATSHLSSFIVIVTLLIVALLLPGERHAPAVKPLLWGTLAAAAYFATFVPAILLQLPRLLSEHGGSAGAYDPFRLPNQVLLELGWPLLILTLMALALKRFQASLPLSRSQVIMGVALAILAQVSPIEVRYVLALVPLIVVCAASALAEPGDAGARPQSLLDVLDFSAAGMVRSGAISRLFGYGLVLASVLHGASVLGAFAPLWSGAPRLLH